MTDAEFIAAGFTKREMNGVVIWERPVSPDIIRKSNEFARRGVDLSVKPVEVWVEGAHSLIPDEWRDLPQEEFARRLQKASWGLRGFSGPSLWQLIKEIFRRKR